MPDMNEHCFIWTDYPAEINVVPGTEQITVRSDRAGGDYAFSSDVLLLLKDLPVPAKVRLTTWLVDQRAQGDTTPLITKMDIENARNSNYTPVHERAERLLRFLIKSSSAIGSVIIIGRKFQPPDAYINNVQYQERPYRSTEENVMAWTESISCDEVVFLIDYLSERGWINDNKRHSSSQCTVLINGYRHLEDQLNSPPTAQAFVAMWFDPKTVKAYTHGIKPGIEGAGYRPLRIDQKEHINQIDDEIIAEIRRSKFLVADFTQDENGARGGVYYEAGFARGLGIPVFYTCYDGSKDNLHFDTRQFNHILWETPEELCKSLKNRIEAVIKKGPHVPPTES